MTLQVCRRFGRSQPRKTDSFGHEVSWASWLVRTTPTLVPPFARHLLVKMVIQKAHDCSSRYGQPRKTQAQPKKPKEQWLRSHIVTTIREVPSPENVFVGSRIDFTKSIPCDFEDSRVLNSSSCRNGKYESSQATLSVLSQGC